MNRQQKQFVKTVWDFYYQQGRAALPWRKTTKPYKIVVSELMLQQTQVDRVIPKYQMFMAAFPTTKKLAEASLGDVLRLWQGLGYNRRAKLLHACAQYVHNKCDGRWPKDVESLKQLPGIGPYTAGAVMAFAYNQAVPLIETNVRTVYLHHFFRNKIEVLDSELMTLIEQTMDGESPREWYWALMDYGSYIKKTHGNPNGRSKTYTKQSKFAGSDRQIRGALIKLLSESQMTRKKILTKLNHIEDIRIDAQLEKLVAEEMVVIKKQSYQLP